MDPIAAPSSAEAGPGLEEGSADVAGGTGFPSIDEAGCPDGSAGAAGPAMDSFVAVAAGTGSEEADTGLEEAAGTGQAPAVDTGLVVDSLVAAALDSPGLAAGGLVASQ